MFAILVGSYHRGVLSSRKPTALRFPNFIPVEIGPFQALLNRLGSMRGNRFAACSVLERPAFCATSVVEANHSTGTRSESASLRGARSTFAQSSKERVSR